MRLDGKVAIVSGGGTGIGAAVARRFVAAGAKVVVMGRRPGPLQQVAQDTGAVAVPGDAGVAADAARAVAAAGRLGGVDVVVAGAGGHGLASALDTTDADFAAALHANLTTAFVLVREALPHLVARRGAIVIISSISGHFAAPEVLGYTVAKHGLTGLARSLARDYGPRGVRVNVVSPGWVRTPMADEEMDDLAARTGRTREQAYAAATAEVPLRRPGTPAEIASICLFLASEESSIMTGAVLFADGGAHVVDLPTLEFERGAPTGEGTTT